MRDICEIYAHYSVLITNRFLYAAKGTMKHGIKLNNVRSNAPAVANYIWIYYKLLIIFVRIMNRDGRERKQSAFRVTRNN